MTTLTTNKTTDLFINALGKFSSFLDLRERSLAYLKASGLPFAKSEEYKFTPISKKIEQGIEDFTSAAKAPLSRADVSRHIFEGFEGDLIVFNNGHFEPELSSISGQNFSLEQLTASKTGVGDIAKMDSDPFVALNNVCFEDGVFIHVPKNRQIENPIYLLHFQQAHHGQVISPRVFIKVEENAAVTFLENTISLDESTYFANSVTEVQVGKNAHVDYYRLQNENKNAVTVSNFETDVTRDAVFTSAVITLSGDMVRNNLTLNLLDSGCEGNMYGLYLTNGKSHVDNHTNVDHTQPHAESNEHYKGILSDHSKGVFNGKIFVRQDAQKTNAFQQNNNILMSDDAVIHTKPQLEIWADDVKCSHGCTTGQLDEEALFYIQSRGIGKEKAKGMLLYAFAGEILDRLKVAPFRDYCVALVAQRLGSKF